MMQELLWNISLAGQPRAALMALGIHGPNSTEEFISHSYWWLHLYSYSATLRIGGVPVTLRPGYATLIPPGVMLEYDFVDRSSHLCAHFTLPESDDPGFEIPAVRDLGSSFPSIYSALEDAASWFATQPVRAEVRLWDVLWQVVSGNSSGERAPIHPHPAPVERARQIIELRLSEPLSVREIADEIGISHNHLTRLFHLVVGDTVIGYIRGRRVQRARHLLENTTLPVKTIAAQVGVEDAGQFHKLIRERLGASPTQVRQGIQIAGRSPKSEAGSLP